MRRCPLVDALHPALPWRHAPAARGRALRTDLPRRPASTGDARGMPRIAQDPGQDPPPAPPVDRGTNDPVPLSPPLPPCPPRSFRREPSGVRDGEGRDDRARDEARPSASSAGRLTDLQWDRVEAWLVRARRSLGGVVWRHIGSGAAFRRLRGRLRAAALPRGARGSRPRGIVEPPTGAEREPSADIDDISGGSATPQDDALPDRAALVIEATLWSLVPERERSALGSSFPAKNSGGAEVHKDATRGGGSGHGGRDDPGALGPHWSDIGDGGTDLAVSVSRARRFIKACRLVDGVDVLEADVDLALRRWGEVRRSRSTARSVGIPEAGARDEGRAGSEGGTISGGSKLLSGSPLASSEALAPPSYRLGEGLCKAVGCSEAARYGSLIDKGASYCRGHRKDGMVDKASSRWVSWPEIGKSAVTSFRPVPSA